jgi:hypothetical protein
MPDGEVINADTVESTDSTSLLVKVAFLAPALLVRGMTKSICPVKLPTLDVISILEPLAIG